MVRLLGRISDKRLFFEDSKTLIDHGTTVGVTGATVSQDVATHFKSVIWGWVHIRTSPTVAFVSATGGNAMVIKQGADMAAGTTIDWYAIGYTA